MATTQQVLDNTKTLLERIKTEGVTSGGVQQPISAESLNTALTAAKLPTVEPTWTPPITPIQDITKKDTSGYEDILKQYLGSQEAPASSETAYTQAQGQSGIDAISQAGVQAQQQLDALNAELKGITDAGTQANLTLEQQAGGKDVTTQFLGRQQQEINRQTAIKALPLQAQVLAQQAVVTGNQGLLKLAQDKLDTLFTLKSKDIENQYNYKQKLIDAVYEYATKQEQAKLDAKRLENEQAFTLQRDEAAREHDILMEKIEQQSPEYQLGLQQKQLQIQKLRQELSGGYENNSFDGFLPETDIRKIDISPQGKSVKSLGTLKQKIQVYKDLVSKYGTSSFGKQKAQLESAYADLKIAYKEAANLGALTGPDVALLEEAIKPATSGWFGGQWWKVATGQGKKTIISSLDTALNSVNKNAVSNIQQLYARDPRYASSYYVQEITNPFKDNIVLSDTQIQELTKGLSPEQIQQLKDEGLLPQ